MIRFIFVCMALVALSILATAGQFMVDGINSAKEGVLARNTVAQPMDQTASVQPTGPSFEQIYANAPAPSQDTSPEGLNNIESAAGGNDSFTGGFTNVAPKALAEPAAPVLDDTQAAEPASN